MYVLTTDQSPTLQNPQKRRGFCSGRIYNIQSNSFIVGNASLFKAGQGI